MPNWCENNLCVEGPKKDLDRFLKLAKSKEIEGEQGSLSLRSIRPMPEDPDERIRQSNGTWSTMMDKMLRGDKEISIEDRRRDSWYHWCAAHWGTKWDVDVYTFTKKKNKALWSFGSAWSPPTEAFYYAAEKFPKLKFTLEYWEYGNDFAGVLVLEDGEEVEHQQGTPREFDFSRQEAEELEEANG